MFELGIVIRMHEQQNKCPTGSDAVGYERFKCQHDPRQYEDTNHAGYGYQHDESIDAGVFEIEFAERFLELIRV